MDIAPPKYIKKNGWQTTHNTEQWFVFIELYYKLETSFLQAAKCINYDYF